MVVSACSRPLNMRVMINVPAQANAETIGKNAATWNAAVPGRRIINTPIKPTAAASQRRKPTLSPRKTIEARIRAMPRNGRSALAGAVRLACGLSAKVALSSLAVVAVGGITGELGGKSSTQLRLSKTIIDRARQAPKTGSRYARLRAQ